MAYICIALSLLGCTSAAFTFATIGDWGGAHLGGYHETDELAVAKQMGQTAESLGIQLVLNTGDNFYYCGVQSLTDKQFKVDFEDVFTHKSLSVPWYGVLGNHDYAYDPTYQLKYKSPNNDRWQMPARYFTHRQLLGGSQYATFVFIDTNPCVASYRADDPSGWDPCSPEYADECLGSDGKCHFHEHIIAQDCGAQFKWLKSTLDNITKDDWIIVVGHHPANEINVQDFTSLLLDKPINLYLNGHTHALSRYQFDGHQGVDFVLSGAGCMVKTLDQDRALPSNVSNSPTELFYRKIAGFTTHVFSEDFSTLTTKYIDAEGNEINSFVTSKNPGPSPGPTPGPSPGPKPSSDSCSHYGCGKYDPSHSCQCNTYCKEHGDCCSDYDKTCGGGGGGSCSTYGCVRYNREHSCQCNSYCKEHGDCCSDYDQICGGASVAESQYV